MSDSRTARTTTPRAATVTILPPRENTIEAKIERTADFCHRAARTAVNAILDAGKKLAELKAELRGKDEWLAAFGEGSGRQRIAHNPFPFNSRTAEKFITIHERFGGHSVTTLPPSWATLYELAKLTDAELKANRGKIRPDMTRVQARALVAKPLPKKGTLPPHLPQYRGMTTPQRVQAEADERLAADLFRAVRALESAASNLCNHSKSNEDARRRLAAAIRSPWDAMTVGIKETITEGKALRTKTEEIQPGMLPSDGEHGRVLTLVRIEVQR